MTFHAWLTFVLATAVLLAIPGPTVLMVIGQSLGAGRRHALPLVAGVALGDFTAMTLSLAGLGALLAASAAAFTLLKWVGAAYLNAVHLGKNSVHIGPAAGSKALKIQSWIMFQFHHEILE